MEQPLHRLRFLTKVPKNQRFSLGIHSLFPATCDLFYIYFHSLFKNHFSFMQNTYSKETTCDLILCKEKDLSHSGEEPMNPIFILAIVIHVFFIIHLCIFLLMVEQSICLVQGARVFRSMSQTKIRSLIYCLHSLTRLLPTLNQSLSV